jgi:hypothetical protein
MQEERRKERHRWRRKEEGEWRRQATGMLGGVRVKKE